MAHDAHAGPVETGAAMDYIEHEKTYHLFVGLAKYGALGCVALCAAMAFSFFTVAGWFSGIILFALIFAAGAAVLR